MVLFKIFSGKIVLHEISITELRIYVCVILEVIYLANEIEIMLHHYHYISKHSSQNFYQVKVLNNYGLVLFGHFQMELHEKGLVLIKDGIDY